MKENLKNISKKQCFIAVGILVIIIGCITTSVIQQKYKRVTYTCESSISYNKGIGINFEVENNEIKAIIKRDTVTKEFIRQNLKDIDLNAAFEAYKTASQKTFEEMAKTYKENKQFSMSYDAKDDNIVLEYRVNVGSEDFDFEKSKELLTELDLLHYYDKESKRFIYDEEKFLKDSPLSTIPKVSCNKSE